MFQILKVETIPSAGTEVSLSMGLLGKGQVTFNTFHKDLSSARIYIRSNYFDYVRSNIDRFIRACFIIEEQLQGKKIQKNRSKEKLNQWISFTWQKGVTYRESLEALSKIYPHLYYLLPAPSHKYFKELKDCCDEICSLNALMILEIRDKIQPPFQTKTNLTAA